MGMLVNNPHHKVVVWVNDEPVKVFKAGHGGPVPLRMVAKKGMNRAWVTVEGDGDLTGNVSVEVKEGSWMDPENIEHHFDWNSSKQSDRSPVFEFDQGYELIAETEGLEKLSVTKQEAAELAEQQYAVIEQALKRKDFQLLGISSETINTMMKKVMNTDDFYQKVFEVDDYEYEALCEVEDLDVIVGDKKILIYNSNGGAVFRAGPLNRDSQGEMVYSFMVHSISVGQRDGEWVLLIF